MSFVTFDGYVQIYMNACIFCTKFSTPLDEGKNLNATGAAPGVNFVSLRSCEQYHAFRKNCLYSKVLSNIFTVKC